MNDSECMTYENVPGVTELFTEEAFAQLGRDQALSNRIAVLRDREEGQERLHDRSGRRKLQL